MKNSKSIEERSIEERLSRVETMYLAQQTVFNIDDLKRYTGLSKSCLYKKTSTGQIPCFKPAGKQIFFNKAEIDGWLQQNRVKTSGEVESEAVAIVTLKRKRSR